MPRSCRTPSRGEDVAVARRRHDLRRCVFGQQIGMRSAIGMQHLADAGDLRAAAAAAAPALLPATSTCTSPPMAAAAEMTLRLLPSASRDRVLQ